MLKRSNMSTVGLLGKKRRNRLKIIFEKIMAKNLSKVIQKKTNKQTNKKKPKPCHELNQLSKPVKGLVLVTQSCPTLCNPMDCSPPGLFVHGILQQEYWSGFPCPSPGDLPNPQIEPRSAALQADYCLNHHPKGINTKQTTMRHIIVTLLEVTERIP